MSNDEHTKVVRDVGTVGEVWGSPQFQILYTYEQNLIFQLACPTLESGINIVLRLLFFRIFSRGYGLIPDFIEPILSSMYKYKV